MTKIRWWAKAKASILGYFWLPCPICDEMFAGFESGEQCLMVTYYSGISVCSKPDCQAIAKQKNEALAIRAVQMQAEWDKATPKPWWRASD